MKKDYSIIENALGCDFVVDLSASRGKGQVRVLQLTDPQMIDTTQIGDGSVLPSDDHIKSRMKAWRAENFDCQCGNHIRSLVAQTNPDLIFITGDLVYGRYDNDGSALRWLASLLDSFAIPWAPVFGNHDNEASVGVDYQCKIFEDSEYCLLKEVV
jgi:3',5'-cyclic AMP phosphodiesterase CpdA